MSNDININITSNTATAPSAVMPPPVIPNHPPVKAPDPLSPHRVLIDEVITKWNFGELHYHSEIERIIGIPYRITTSEGLVDINRRYNRTLSKANKILTNHGRRLQSVKPDGYELLEHKHYVNATYQKLKEAKTKVKLGVKISNATDRSQLTQNELQIHDW